MYLTVDFYYFCDYNEYIRSKKKRKQNEYRSMHVYQTR